MAFSIALFPGWANQGFADARTRKLAKPSIRSDGGDVFYVDYINSSTPALLKDIRAVHESRMTLYPRKMSTESWGSGTMFTEYVGRYSTVKVGWSCAFILLDAKHIVGTHMTWTRKPSFKDLETAKLIALSIVVEP